MPEVERFERQQDRKEERREERRDERRDERREERRDYGLVRLEYAADPVFQPGRPTKILISPGNGMPLDRAHVRDTSTDEHFTGAGWITYAPRGSSDQFLVWMLTYEPMIRALERREPKGTRRIWTVGSNTANRHIIERLEELLRDFHREAHSKFGVERIMCARVTDLVVHEVNSPFEVHETDGAERVVDVTRRRFIPLGAVVY